MQRAERRNISVTNDEVSKALDQSDNASKYIERAILYYLEHSKQDQNTLEELEEVKKQIEILNKNYLKQKDTLSKLVDSLFGRGNQWNLKALLRNLPKMDTR